MYNTYLDYRSIILNLLFNVLTYSFENDIVNNSRYSQKVIKIMNNWIIISQSMINKILL